MRYFIIFFLILMWSCQETPQLENFDANIWKKDKSACEGKRKELFAKLKPQLDKLKGLGQNQVLQLLGKPDFHELHTRNQRFYIYFFDKGAQCDKQIISANKVNIDAPHTLKIRFSALDKVNEIIVK